MLKIHNNFNNKIAELISGKIEISNVADALELMGNCYSLGAGKIIINKENLCPEFFKLETGIAGEILQKFVTYNVVLAIIGDFSMYQSKSLNNFIYESNKTGQFIFISSFEEAINKLAL